MFEKFEVEGLFVKNPAILSLYSNGRTTGIVCDSGDSVTQIIPIYAGNSIPRAIKTSYIAGRAITDHLSKLLENEGFFEQGKSFARRQLSKNIKEKHCFVSLDPTADKYLAAESGEI